MARRLRLWREATPQAVVAEIVLVGYLSTASFKAMLDSSPIDITLLLALGLVMTAAVMFYTSRGQIPLGLLWALLYFALGLIPIVLHGWLSSYGTAKVVEFYTVSLVAVFGTGFVVRNFNSAERVILMLIVPGVVLSVFGLIAYAGGTDRLSIGDVSTVTLGRALGTTVLLCSLYAVYVKGSWGLVATGFAVFALAVLLFVGNRQGVVAAALALTATLGVTIVQGRFQLDRSLKFVFVIGLVIASFPLIVKYIPGDSIYRFYSIISIGSDASSQIRLLSMDAALTEAVSHPLGSGWGAFHALGIYDPDGLNVAYPHNIFIETFHELGFFTLIALVVWVMIALRRTYIGMSIDHTFGRIAIFAFLVYNIILSSISGEASSEKVLWAVLTLCVIVPPPRPAVAGQRALARRSPLPRHFA